MKLAQYALAVLATSVVPSCGKALPRRTPAAAGRHYLRYIVALQSWRRRVRAGIVCPEPEPCECHCSCPETRVKSPESMASTHCLQLLASTGHGLAASHGISMPQVAAPHSMALPGTDQWGHAHTTEGPVEARSDPATQSSSFLQDPRRGADTQWAKQHPECPMGTPCFCDCHCRGRPPQNFEHSSKALLPCPPPPPMPAPRQEQAEGVK